MQVKLAYGKEGLLVDIPGQVDVISTQFTPGLSDESEAIRHALRHPIDSPGLSQMVKPGQKVTIVHSDLTRATPNKRILPVLLSELETSGIPSTDITILNGLGMHRPQTPGELVELLGDQIVQHYRCIQHDSLNNSNLSHLGTSSFGHPIYVNRTFLESDFRIVTGFIEPHFFAGFSGGPKGIMPGIAGAQTVMANHGKEMIANPNATWGITQGNPIWEEMLEDALLTHPDFLLNVTLNAKGEITGVFAGDLQAAHKAGYEYLRQSAMVKVHEPYDIVITTNSGYPLDQNLYQSVKGISAARQIVREGGAIIIATACADGLPDFGHYAELLSQTDDPSVMLDWIEHQPETIPDQWQVQIQALIQQHAEVYVYSDGLSDKQIRRAMFFPTRNIPATVSDLRDRYGKNARICELPEGPQTIAHL